jgi:RNA polymerase sigma-70 factor (ECF subfamily)
MRIPMLPDALDRFRPLLRLYVRQLQLGRLYRARFDSSDVVQDALRRAVEGLDGFRGQGDAELVAWLQKVVGSAFLDLVRHHDAHQRDPRLEQAIEDAVGDGDTPLGAYLTAVQPGPSTLAVRGEELLRLAVAVDHLPEAERDAVIAHYILELPLAEVATRIGRTDRAVAGLLVRGKRRLRELLTATGDER